MKKTVLACPLAKNSTDVFERFSKYVMVMAMMIPWAWTWSASLADNWDWLTQRAPSEQERWTASWRKQKTKQIQKTNIVDKTELTATDALPSIFLSSFILIYDLTWEKSQWENTLHGKKQIRNKEKHKQKAGLKFWWKRAQGRGW